jgi:hypothetical protein
VPKCQSARVPKCQGAKVPRCQSAKVLGALVRGVEVFTHATSVPIAVAQIPGPRSLVPDFES